MDYNGSAAKKKILYGLIGRNISYSFSRPYFNSKFKAEGLNDQEYVNFDLSDIREIRSLLKRSDILGLNVTIPYKEAVIPYLDSLTDLARTVGAVNTIGFTPNGSLGHNTDVTGFSASLKPLLLAGDRKALVLGTGGASRAVVYALKGLGMEVFRVSRSHGSAEQVYSGLSQEIMDHCTVIVNTTPLGSSQFPGAKPDLPYHFLDSRHLLYDLIYKPERTPFLIEGVSRGCRVKNGLEMLEYQAEAAWTFWTNSNAENAR